MLRPRVLLLDEPLGALDAKLRKQLQLELRAVQREVGITFVYVTHDQEEALTMSDQIAVLAEGRVEQVGPPQEIYSAPATTFVAGFLGAANIFDADVLEAVDGSAVCSALDTRLGAAVDGRRGQPGAAAIVIRPERITRAGRRRAGRAGRNVIGGVVSQVVYLGNCTQVHVDVGAPDGADRRGAQPCRARRRSAISRGERVNCVCTHDAVRVLHRSSAAVDRRSRSPKTSARSAFLDRRRRFSARQVEFPLGEPHRDVVGHVGVDLGVLQRDLDGQAVEQRGELQREHPDVDCRSSELGRT